MSVPCAASACQRLLNFEPNDINSFFVLFLTLTELHLNHESSLFPGMKLAVK